MKPNILSHYNYCKTHFEISYSFFGWYQNKFWSILYYIFFLLVIVANKITLQLYHDMLLFLINISAMQKMNNYFSKSCHFHRICIMFLLYMCHIISNLLKSIWKYVKIYKIIMFDNNWCFIVTLNWFHLI